MDRLLDDGFGNVWEKCEHDDCALQIVRPGKVQCERCQYGLENFPGRLEGHSYTGVSFMSGIKGRKKS